MKSLLKPDHKRITGKRLKNGAGYDIKYRKTVVFRACAEAQEKGIRNVHCAEHIPAWDSTIFNGMPGIYGDETKKDRFSTPFEMLRISHRRSQRPRLWTTTVKNR